MDLNKWRKYTFQVTMGGAILFTFLSIIAMFVYAGGTYDNPASVGYNFFENYFSDLGRTISHSGDQNTISWIFFTIAMIAAGLGFLSFFSEYHCFFAEEDKTKKISIIASIIGLIAGFLFLSIGLIPSDVNQPLHLALMYTAFAFISLAVVMFTVVLYLNRNYPRPYFYTFIIETIVIFLYLGLLFFGPSRFTTEGLLIQATGQKLAVYSLVISFLIQGYGAWKFQQSN
jgi:hypothetical protein